MSIWASCQWGAPSCTTWGPTPTWPSPRAGAPPVDDAEEVQHQTQSLHGGAPHVLLLRGPVRFVVPGSLDVGRAPSTASITSVWAKRTNSGAPSLLSPESDSHEDRT